MYLLHFCFVGVLVLQSQGKSIDERILDAVNDISDLDIVADEKSKTLRVELDILWRMEDYVRIQKKRMDEKKGRTKRKAILPDTLRWTNKEVPYKFQALAFTASERNTIKDAIAQWNNYTCLNMRPSRFSDSNEIRFQNGAGCSSYIGMIGGTQPVNLARGCRYVDIVVHEIGHAIGFYHEQSRRDRDSYVEIIESNVPSNLLYNFNKADPSEITNLGVPYDYLSVMHYSGTAFGIGGQTTIRTLDPSFQNVIGSAPGLSFMDIRLANLMYSCNENCASQDPCPGQGFQGEDCECYCPKDDPNEPIRLCDDSDASVTTDAPPTTDTPGPGCEDRLRLCPLARNLCNRLPFQLFMNIFCKSTCNACSTPPETLSCQDFGQNCKFLKKQGICENKDMGYMQVNCKQTCGLCNATPVGSAPSNGSVKHQGSIVGLVFVFLFGFIFNMTQ